MPACRQAGVLLATFLSHHRKVPRVRGEAPIAEGRHCRCGLRQSPEIPGVSAVSFFVLVILHRRIALAAGFPVRPIGSAPVALHQFDRERPAAMPADRIERRHRPRTGGAFPGICRRLLRGEEGERYGERRHDTAEQAPKKRVIPLLPGEIPSGEGGDGAQQDDEPTHASPCEGVPRPSGAAAGCLRQEAGQTVSGRGARR